MSHFDRLVKEHRLDAELLGPSCEVVKVLLLLMLLQLESALLS